MPGAFQGLLCSEEILWRIYLMKILDIYICCEHIICCWGCLCLSRCNPLFLTINVFLSPSLSNSSVTFPTVFTFFPTLFPRLFVHPKFSRAICSVLLLHIQHFSLAWMLILLQLPQCCCLCDVHSAQDLWNLIYLRACYSIIVIQRLLKLGFSTLLSL